ncbi:hypothetical protein P8452_62220 [Trifolium repens]|nr:hypothetical protein P8452_62216 [Trifolium repens]WJX79065.1 hypothetical protein P8452_62220 [Trifolium repens]
MLAMRLSGNDVLSDQNINVGFLPEEELYKSLEEIEADTIGDLLPMKMICFLQWLGIGWRSWLGILFVFAAIWRYPNHLNAPCKHQGFVLVSYYDLRAAQNAMKALQNRSFPKIYEYPEMNHIKYIEFYDVRDEPDLGHNLNDILFLRQKGVSSGVIASGGSLENGYNHRFQSESQLPLNAFIDNTIFHSISNAARGAFAVTVCDARESSNAVDAMKFASIPSFRPHSLPEYRDGLANDFSWEKWEKFNSEKVAALAYARIQGKSALIAHFQNSSLMNEDKRCRPFLFHIDGTNAGDDPYQEPFPSGANVRVRPGKLRNWRSEENRIQGNSSTLASAEEFASGEYILHHDYGIDFDDDDQPVELFRCKCGSKFCRNMKRSNRTIRS